MTQNEINTIEAVKLGLCFRNAGRPKQGGKRYGGYYFSDDKEISENIIARLYNKGIIKDGEIVKYDGWGTTKVFKLQLNGQ